MRSVICLDLIHLIVSFIVSGNIWVVIDDVVEVGGGA